MSAALRAQIITRLPPARAVNHQLRGTAAETLSLLLFFRVLLTPVPYFFNLPQRRNCRISSLQRVTAGTAPRWSRTSKHLAAASSRPWQPAARQHSTSAHRQQQLSSARSAQT
jgi:hypothetical protein